MRIISCFLRMIRHEIKHAINKYEMHMSILRVSICVSILSQWRTNYVQLSLRLVMKKSRDDNIWMIL